MTCSGISLAAEEYPIDVERLSAALMELEQIQSISLSRLENARAPFGPKPLLAALGWKTSSPVGLIDVCVSWLIDSLAMDPEVDAK